MSVKEILHNGAVLLAHPVHIGLKYLYNAGRPTVHACRQIPASCQADSSLERWYSRLVRLRRLIDDFSARRWDAVLLTADLYELWSAVPWHSVSVAPGRTDARLVEPSNTSWSSMTRSLHDICMLELNCCLPTVQQDTTNQTEKNHILTIHVIFHNI